MPLYLKRLGELREKTGKTQAEVAEYLGISPAKYKRYEETDCSRMSGSNMIKLTELYNVSSDYIVELSDIPNE